MHNFLKASACCFLLIAVSDAFSAETPKAAPHQIAPGPFEPTWQSLKQYEVPEWFRDAKFGIWAHWGPQCQPERGDWYARGMYQEGSGQYRFHTTNYGHPSRFGFKDVIHEWKAEKWDPDKLVALYKRVGAQYFFAMANHHDNLDMWDSKYQSWNSVKVGPKKNIIEGWARAARKNKLPFGVSVHASHAWSWYEAAQGADTNGPLAGVPFDGKLRKEDGAGKWWEGLDPQELYEQNHKPAIGFDAPNKIHTQWHWDNGASIPDAAYCEKFYNRTVDLIDNYRPDLVYFDDTALPLWPISDAGLRIAAHYYNSNRQWHRGNLEAVLFGKILNEQQQDCLVWDIERGSANKIEPFPWQTCTCIGSWHYNRSIHDRNTYKTPKMVIHMLADIVSKNGNLLLNIPLRGDGSIDDKEIKILEEIGSWMKVNKEAIVGTRPWKLFGEGPALAGAEMRAQGFNEGRGRPFTEEDIRFTTRDNTLYAILMGWPNGQVTIKSLADAGKVRTVRLLGHKTPLKFTQDANGLKVNLPTNAPGDHAFALKISGLKLKQ
jgi:alpha-L-fucosidase